MTISEHTDLELVNAVLRGHRSGDPPPLEDGEPVPGCGCPECTGIAEDDPVRGRPRPGTRSPRDALPVEDARRVPILQVVDRLGLGEPVGRWGEPKVCCPFHDDHDPSLRLNVDAGLWYCDPCAIGGDGIELWRRVRGVSFADAVQELAA